MTNYADYTYYIGIYKGAVIDTASFNKCARKATLEIKKYTFNRVDDASIPDDVKMCCCEVVEAIHKSETEDTKGIASEKVGEYSVSYVSPEAKEKLLSVSVRSIIYNWLSMTSLLYRGC
jgi:hypothetical protein